MIILTLFLFGFQVSSTYKLQIVRFVTVLKQAECKLLLGHLYSKLHIQLGNFEPRISTVGAKRSLSVEVDRKEMVLRTVSSYKLELIKRQVSYCSVCCYASLVLYTVALQAIFGLLGSKRETSETMEFLLSKQLFEVVFSCFEGQKFCFQILFYITASALKSCLIKNKRN